MHPKVEEKYRKNDFEVPYDSANDSNLKSFWTQANQSNVPVTKDIYKIVRLKHRGVEYFYYHVKYTSRDVLGNKIEAMEYDKGYYEDPQFKFNYVMDPKTGTQKKTVTEVESTERIYELKWPKDFTQELQDQVVDSVDLLVISTGRKYGGYTFDDFKERTFDELVTLGRFGTLNPVVIEAVKKNTKQTTQPSR